MVNNSFLTKNIKGAIFSALFVLAVFNIQADDNLDILYKQGFEFSKQGENKKAFLIMQQLATKNYPPAVQNVALSYYYGLGVVKNISTAKIYFTKAHNLGILDATNELANIYYSSKNINKAKYFWHIASDGGNEYGSYNLAMLYLENGDVENGKKFLLKAKEQNHPLAYKVLTQLNL